MKRWIKHIQQQPHIVKSNVAFIGASLCTGIVVLIWLTTLPARFSDIGKGANAVQNSALTEHALSAYDIYTQTVEKAHQAASSSSAEAPVSKSEIEDKVSALIDSVRQNDLKTASGQVASSTPPSPTPSPSSPTIMIEVAPSATSSSQAHTDDSNIGKPVLIETR